MGRCRFVMPEEITIPLSGGEAITVQRRLNAGAHQDVFARLLPNGITPGQPLNLDLARVSMVRILSYLLGWTLVDWDGQPVPMNPGMTLEERESVLRNLDLDTFAEIRDAIDAHVEADDAARDAAKNAADPPPGIRIAS